MAKAKIGSKTRKVTAPKKFADRIARREAIFDIIRMSPGCACAAYRIAERIRDQGYVIGDDQVGLEVGQLERSGFVEVNETVGPLIVKLTSRGYTMGSAELVRMSAAAPHAG